MQKISEITSHTMDFRYFVFFMICTEAMFLPPHTPTLAVCTVGVFFRRFGGAFRIGMGRTFLQQRIKLLFIHRKRDPVICPRRQICRIRQGQFLNAFHAGCNQRCPIANGICEVLQNAAMGRSIAVRCIHFLRRFPMRESGGFGKACFPFRDQCTVSQL